MPRTEVNWFAGFKFADGPNDAWHVCRVMDLSLSGAALEVYSDVPARKRDFLVLDFEMSDHHAGLPVVGRVVRRTSMGPHSVLLAVEFVDADERTHVALETMLRLRVASGRGDPEEATG